MRRTIKRISTCCWLSLACLLAASCIKEDNGYSSATADVNLVFSTRADEGSSGNLLEDEGVPAGPHEGIKTLRIIVVDEYENVVKNEHRDYRDGEENGIQNEKQLIIFDVPVGKHTFYVIANEESLGKAYTNEELENTYDWDLDTHKLEFPDENNLYFPKKSDEITEKGLPITNKMEVDVRPDMEPVRISIIHAAVKMNIRFVNTTDEEIVINQVQFGPFIGDRMYLFPERQLDVPNDARYTGVNFGGDSSPLGIEVPAGGEASFVCYTYPSFAWKGGLNTPYTLGLVTEGGTYEKQPFVDSETGQPLNSISRNSQVNVTATIKGKASLVVNFKVTDWESANVPVPPFN